MSTASTRWSYLGQFTEVELPECCFPKREFFRGGTLSERYFDEALWNDTAGGSVLCLVSGNRAGVVLLLNSDAFDRGVWHRFALACASQVLLLWKRFHADDLVLSKALQTKGEWLAGSATDEQLQRAERQVQQFQKRFELGLDWRMCEVVRLCCQLDFSQVAKAAREAVEIELAFACQPGLWIEQTLADLMIELLETRKAAKNGFGDWQQTALTALKRRRGSLAKAIAASKPPRLWCVGSDSPDSMAETLWEAAPLGGKKLFFADRGEVGEVLDWSRLLFEFQLQATEPLVEYWEKEFPAIKQVPRAIVTLKSWIAGNVSDRKLQNAIQSCDRAIQELTRRREFKKSERDSPQRTAALALGIAATHLGPTLETFPALMHFVLLDAHEMLEDAANGALPPQPIENETTAQKIARLDKLLARSLRRLKPRGYSAYRREQMNWLLNKTLEALGKIKMPSQLQKAAKMKLCEELKAMAVKRT